MLITVQDLQKFTNVFPEDDFDLQDMYIGSANDTVINYLGYNPEKATYTKYLSGNGTKIIFIPNGHVQSVTTLEIDDKTITDFIVTDNKIILKNEIDKDSIVKVVYVGGWDTVPVSIKHATLRIAGLMQSEGQNNIGLTGKTIPNEGSRTFYNYTNYNKYLLPISCYKLVR